jgi:hypothetical protein
MSTLERELKELQERPKFHAKPFNKKLLINKPIIQHAKASPKLLSFEEFSLSKPLEKQPEPELTFPQFKANKLNKNVLNQPVNSNCFNFLLSGFLRRKTRKSQNLKNLHLKQKKEDI